MSEDKVNRTVGVRYIGQRATKTDNVCGTKHQWFPGTVEQCAPEVALRLFKHKTVWVPEDASFELPRAAVPAEQVVSLLEQGQVERLRAARPVLVQQLEALFGAPGEQRELPVGAQAAAFAARPGGELLTEHWIEALLKGRCDEIEAKLAAATSLLVAAPWLLDACGQAEDGGRARNNVLELIEKVELEITVSGPSLDGVTQGHDEAVGGDETG